MAAEQNTVSNIDSTLTSSNIASETRNSPPTRAMAGPLDAIVALNPERRRPVAAAAISATTLVLSRGGCSIQVFSWTACVGWKKDWLGGGKRQVEVTHSQGSTPTQPLAVP